ncbi:MAG TPA: translation initiation factor IF-2 [Candidatus Rifleibacterium sp.]|nr:translation initiation factor IF-2 [Candidatus Rifleibacterium sp.]HPT45984.1 translation initiation factor IF-2 [Candidatus Rifleibacterium sp.]
MGIRLHEASKKYNLSNKDMADLLANLGYKGKTNPLAGLPDEMLDILEKHFATPKSGQPAKPVVTATPQPQPAARPKTDLPRPAVQAVAQPAPKPVVATPVAAVSQAVNVEKNAVIDKKSHDDRLEKEKLEKKKIGPKPVRIEEEEEVEVNKQITIIKTASPKKETQAPIKKKSVKNKTKRAHFSKKVQAEMREAERQTEAILDRTGKAENLEEDPDSLPKVLVPTDITVSQLAKYLEIDAVNVVKKLFSLGVMASLNQRLELEQMQLIGQEFGKEVVFTENVFEIEDTPDLEGDLRTRPPVVTIMGHVDHGKTSLIDYIRKAHVADKEVGGITQHIGAYQVKLNTGTITFIDTPGHEAFTAMRAQGALVTDIAILVVAADDGVQPQTIEAIHHAQAAGVPIIVAINKIDKPEANIDRVKQQLMPYNLVSDDWGGQTTMVPVSAKAGTNVSDLLEMILLQAEMMDLKANPLKAGIGTIIEARLDKGMGPMATVLVQNGRLQMSDHIICGSSFGRVKALVNDAGGRVKEAGPAFPVVVLGLNDVPRVGDKMAVVESAKFARYVGELRQKKAREERLSRENRIKLADLFKQVTEGQAKELNIIIKADVQGSSGAMKDALERLSTDEVKVNVIHTGVGGITEADVNLASASNAIIIGFHVRPMPNVEDAAKAEDVEIKVFRIIYDAIDAVKLALKGMYEPEYEEEILGRAEVRKVYKVSGVGVICGSYVTSGSVTRNTSVRIIRDGVEIFEGKTSSVKRFKDDVREVHAGYECGIGVENYNDIKDNDILEFFRLKEIERVI